VNNLVDYANIQWPASGAMCQGGTFDIYGQVYEAGLTNLGGAPAGMTVQYGYSTSNTDPSTWSTWNTAAWNSQSGNNDEYKATLSGLAAGTYYYLFRYSLDGSCFKYGGFNGGFWNGTSNVNGVLTVNAAPTATASDDSRCGAGSITLYASNVSAGATTDWYAAATGGSPLVQANGQYLISNLTVTTTYYLEARNIPLVV
jgi:hypothetical protein